MITLTKDHRMLGYELLGSCSDISHFVTTRQGGCSHQAYASFNCSPYAGDNESDVRRNQSLLVEGMQQQPLALILPHQTHETKSAVIDDSFTRFTTEEKRLHLEGIDAVMTHLPGYCMCVSTADCVPVLLYDKQHRAVAAVHAGWRGTANYMVVHTLERMRVQYGTVGKDVLACIGPSISCEAFEVGEQVYEIFRLQGLDVSRIAVRHPETRKWHIDLWEANRQQLLDFGVPSKQIEVAGVCTYLHYEQFFSARRLGIASGRMLSGIMLHLEEKER